MLRWRFLVLEICNSDMPASLFTFMQGHAWLLGHDRSDSGSVWSTRFLLNFRLYKSAQIVPPEERVPAADQCISQLIVFQLTSLVMR